MVPELASDSSSKLALRPVDTSPPFWSPSRVFCLCLSPGASRLSKESWFLSAESGTWSRRPGHCLPSSRPWVSLLSGPLRGQRQEAHACVYARASRIRPYVSLHLINCIESHEFTAVPLIPVQHRPGLLPLQICTFLLQQRETWFTLFSLHLLVC